MSTMTFGAPALAAPERPASLHPLALDPLFAGARVHEPQREFDATFFSVEAGADRTGAYAQFGSPTGALLTIRRSFGAP